MTQKILMNVSDGDECRIAVTKDGLLQEYFLDRPSQLKHVGDIYRGVVSNTEPAIQAVFVDIGYKKNAFLHASDIIAAYNPRATLTEIYGENPVEVVPVEEIDFDAEPEQAIELEDDDVDEVSSDADESADAEDVEDEDSGQEKAMRETVALEREGDDARDGERRRGRRRRGRRGGRGRGGRNRDRSDASNENGETARADQRRDDDHGERQGSADDGAVSSELSESSDDAKPARKKRVTKKVAKASDDEASQDDDAASKKTSRKKTAKKTTATKKAATKKSAAKKSTAKKKATKKTATKKRATKKLASRSSDSGEESGVTEQNASSASSSSADYSQGRWNDGLDDDASGNMPGGSTPPVRFRREALPKVQNIYRRGQHVLVQVLKAAQGGKGPGVTTYISLPGRYMVLMPNTTKCGVSRKIQDRRLRSELRRSLSRLRIPENMGVIIRTAAAGRPIEELQRDLNYLLKTWNEVLSDVNSGERAPSCSYRDTDPATRTVRDYFTDDVDEIVIDDKAVYDRVANFFDELMPDYRDRVKFYEGKIPLFTAEGVEAQIEHIFDKKVPLPSGGYLFIEQTEALVAIDVNSGRFTSEKDAEETAYKTNMEAIPEITRQLRLRDLGGIIVNDFIDMMNPKYRRDVEDRLRNELHKEKTRVKVAHVSPFGLIEMTRQRVRPSLRNFAYDTCGHCHGSGMLKSAETQALTLLRTVKLILANDAAFGAAVQAPPEVLSFLHSHLRDSVTQIEKDYKKTITFEWSSELGPEEMRFFYVNYRGDRTTFDHIGEIGRYVVAKAPIATGKRSSRRRRGGRGGRGRGGRGGQDKNDSQRNEAVQGSEANGDASANKPESSSNEKDSGSGDQSRSGSSRRGGRRRSSGQRRGQASRRDDDAAKSQTPSSEQSESEAAKTTTRRPSKNADGDQSSDAKAPVAKKATKKAAATKKTATKKVTKKAVTKKAATKKATAKKATAKKTAAKKAPRKTKKKAASSADTQES